MQYQPIPIREGRAKPPINKVMTVKEAVAKFIHEGCYLGMSVSAAPAAIIWEMVRQRDRIKSLDLSITSQIGMSSALIGSGLVNKIEMAYNWGGIEGEDKVFRRAVEKGTSLSITGGRLQQLRLCHEVGSRCSWGLPVYAVS